MSHYTIDFNALPEADRDAAAIESIRDWLGGERYASLNRDLPLAYEVMNIDHFRLMMSFAGIEGFPVTVWHRHLWPAQESPDAQTKTRKEATA